MASTPGCSSNGTARQSYSEEVCRTPSKREDKENETVSTPRTPGIEDMKTAYGFGPEVAEPTSPTSLILHQHGRTRKQARSDTSEDELDDLKIHGAGTEKHEAAARLKKVKYEIFDRSILHDSSSGGDDGMPSEEALGQAAKRFFSREIETLKCALVELQKENRDLKERLEKLEATKTE